MLITKGQRFYYINKCLNASLSLKSELEVFKMSADATTPPIPAFVQFAELPVHNFTRKMCILLWTPECHGCGPRFVTNEGNWKPHLLQLPDGKGNYYFHGDPQAVQKEAMDSFRRLMVVDPNPCAECTSFHKQVLSVCPL